ncbi:MAG: hypothetical protein QM737_15575 [Ferruginibacter sp.]
MKIIKISLTAFVLSVGFVSCKKDVDVTPPIVTPVPAPSSNQNLVTGVWVGESTSTSRTPPVYFSFELQTGGHLILLNANNQDIGSGNWALNNSVLNASYNVAATGITYTLTGELDTSATPVRLYGKWQYSDQYEDSGYWTVERSN